MNYPQYFKRKSINGNGYFMSLRELTLSDCRGSEVEYVNNIRVGLDLVGLYWGGDHSGKTMVTGLIWGKWQRISQKQFSNYILNVELASVS